MSSLNKVIHENSRRCLAWSKHNKSGYIANYLKLRIFLEANINKYGKFVGGIPCLNWQAPPSPILFL